MPAVAPTYRFNDAGQSTFGDSGQTAWAADGTVYQTFGDGTGFNAGCPGSNLLVGKFTGSAPFLTGTNLNCMSSFGTQSQVNSGGWTDGKDWKPGGMQYVADGMTATGLYLWVERDLAVSPFTYSNPFLMYSPDGGATWCAPGDSTCLASGDAPAPGGSMFPDLAIVRFVQFEKGATGAIAFDGNASYLYCIAMRGALPYSELLMRVARGSNLQSATSWQFYNGPIGGDITASANWSTSDSGATVLLTGNDGQVTYIPGFGYLKTDTYSAANDLEFYSAPTLTGPWTGVFYEGPVNPPLYGFPGIDLSSLSVTGRTATANVSFQGSYLDQTNNPATNQYSQFWRKMTLTW